MISQIERLSSSEMKVALRSVRMAVWSCDWCSCIRRAPASGWYSDLTLLAAERAATPTLGILCVGPARPDVFSVGKCDEVATVFAWLIGDDEGL